MSCRPPEQLSLLDWTPRPARRWLSLDERMARRARYCESHETHACPLCETSPAPTRKRKKAEVGVDLRQLLREDPYEARRLARLAESLLRRGAEPAAVHVETCIRMNTLHQMRSRLREEGLIP